MMAPEINTSSKPDRLPTETEPHVSVIMIFLNAARFMEEAIESVLAQTFTSWELLLVDDGSTDDSTRLAKHYVRQHPDCIRYFEHPGHENRGMSTSRNLGIQHARGEFIAFLDADDTYLAEKLENQIAILKDVPEAVMVYSASQYWYNWQHLPKQRRVTVTRKLGVEPDQLVHPPELAKRYLQRVAQTPGMCSFLIRKSVLERVGGFEDEFKDLFEDQVLFYKLALTEPIFVQSGCWDRYRQHPDSTVHRMEASGHYSDDYPSIKKYKFLIWLRDYITATHIQDEEIYSLVESLLRPYRHPMLAARVTQLRARTTQVRRWFRRVRHEFIKLAPLF